MPHPLPPRGIAIAFAAGAIAGAAVAQSCTTPVPQSPCPGPAHWNTQFAGVGVIRESLPGVVLSGAVYQGDLYIGGSFTTVAGVPAKSLARWSATTQQWSAVGAGLGGDPGNLVEVFAMIVYDEDGPGGSPPSLFLGGSFTTAGGAAIPYLARWNGSNFSRVGPANMTGVVRAIAAYRYGILGYLVVGGDIFTRPGGGSARHIARFSSQGLWENIRGIGSSVQSSVDCLTVFDDGSGPTVYAAGDFVDAGCSAGTCDSVAFNVARWSNTCQTWLPVPAPPGAACPPLMPGQAQGANNHCLAMTVIRDATSPIGRSLVVIGYFTSVGGVPSRYIAKWNGSAWVSMNTGGTALNRTPTAVCSFMGSVYVAGPFGLMTEIGVLRLTPQGIWTNAASCSQLPVFNALVPYADAGSRALWALGSFACLDGGATGGIGRLSWCCPGDADGNRAVDFLDLNAVLSDFGVSGSALPGDTNGNGAVDFNDLNLTLGQFGTACP